METVLLFSFPDVGEFAGRIDGHAPRLRSSSMAPDRLKLPPVRSNRIGRSGVVLPVDANSLEGATTYREMQISGKER